MGSINFGVSNFIQRPSVRNSLFAFIGQSLLRLVFLPCIALVLLSVEASFVFGQSGNKGVQKILQQSVSLSIRPSKIAPGETLFFTYKVYPDTLPPHAVNAAQVKLTILPLSRSNPTPSLVDTTFAHLDSYILKANQGGRVPVNFTIDRNPIEQSTTYSIGDVKIDSLKQPADTLAFEFSYQVTTTGIMTCKGLVAGIEAAFSASDVFGGREDLGSIFGTSEIKAESNIIWEFTCDPLRPVYEQIDSVAFKIVYRNEGKVDDRGIFAVKLPFPIRATQSNTVFLQLPAGVSARFSASGDSIIFNVASFPADAVDREILVLIRFTIKTALSRQLDFTTTLISSCDASTQPPKGERKTKSIGIDLVNLLAIEKSALPAAVAPGEPIDYTITITRIDSIGGVLDSVMVTDFLNPGIVAVLNSSPPFLNNDNNQRIAWLLRDFPNSTGATQQITFTTVLGPDFYTVIPAVRDSICTGVDFFNSVLVEAIQNDTTEIQEGVVGDNQRLIRTRVKASQTSLSLNVNIPRSDADPNEVVDLLIIYNSGSSSLIPIKNITIRDTLDAVMQLVSCDPCPDSTAGQMLFWRNLPDLAPGETDTIKLRVKLVALVPCQTDTLFSRAGIASSPAACSLAPPSIDSIILRGTDDRIDLKLVTLPDPVTPVNAYNEEEIQYNLTITNNSQFRAESLTVVDILPARDKFRAGEIFNNGTINPDGTQIVWNIAALDSGQSASVSFRGNLIKKLYCALDSLVNTVIFQATKPAGCPADTIRTVHHIIPTPEDQQAKLRLTGFTYKDANGNRLVEPNEQVTLCLNFTGDQNFKNIAFRNEVSNTNTLIGMVADETILVAPNPDIPNSLNAGQTLPFCFTFQAPANIGADSLFVEGLVTSNLNCGQEIGKIALPTRGAAILTHSLELEDADHNTLASEGEWITAKVTLQHQPNSRFDADSVTLHLEIQIEPGSAPIELPRYSLAAIDTLIPFLLRGTIVSWAVGFRYPDLTPGNHRIVVTAYYTRTGFNAMRSENIEKTINIEHECFAKPRTFIPAVHPNGLKFKPDDDLKVFIIDVDGNKVWEGRTSQPWDGRTSDGRAVPPGTYIFVIEDQCKGTIVLLR
jgi:uncharacterized repeat protein (TIGR01451 family)